MGRLNVTASVDVSGPLSGSQAAAVIEHITAEAAKAIAEEAARRLREFPMDKSGRSAGGFAANVRVTGRGDGYVILGPMIRGVTWAPWLEGTSTRNQSTGFKGYHLFRKTRRELDAGAAQEIAERVVAGHLAELGGS